MSVPQPSSPAHSRWIWPFEVIEQIGEGGMGVVYRARYVVNGRQVALKMLPGDINDKTALARFEREVEVLKTMKHPNIVRCFGGVCEDKRRFYAMELLEGGSLEDQLVAKGKLPWEQVIQYGLQMCAALDYSHEKGVVHRDVKPSNFLIAPSGQIKLSDFGLASVTSTRKITAAGKTAGTFLYMAPEQIRGQEVTPRTDLYALGCVLFELVTGHVPFLGETPGATLHLHCQATPPRPTEKALDCPLQLERVILKLLEKDAENRYQSAADVARELRSVSQTVTVTTRNKSGLADAIAHDNAPTMVDIPRHLERSSATSAFVSTRALMVCAVLLFLSFVWNGYQWSRLSAMKHSIRLWQEAFQSDLPEVRLQAAYALGEMARTERHDLELLKKGLQEPTPQRRTSAIEGLARAGHAGLGALPDLMKIQKADADPVVRDAAAGAIAVIRQAGAERSFPWGKVILGIVFLGLLAGGATFWQRRAA